MPKLHYLLDKTKSKFLELEQLRNKCNVNLNYLQYLSIKAAIPKEWIKILNSNLKISDQCQEMQKVIMKMDNVSKKAYNYMLDKVKNRDDRFRFKWEQILQRDVPDSVWKLSFQRIKQITLSTKLRSFQYRLLNMAIITNKHLKMWKIKDTDLCYFCSKDQETYSHVFVNCSYVKTKIWFPLKRWLYYYCMIELEIDTYQIIFNRYKDSFQDLVNMLILITKQYIYSSRCLEKPLVFTQLIAMIENYRTIENIIARKKNSITMFNKKWSIYDKI